MGTASHEGSHGRSDRRLRPGPDVPGVDARPWRVAGVRRALCCGPVDRLDDAGSRASRTSRPHEHRRRPSQLRDRPPESGDPEQHRQHRPDGRGHGVPAACRPSHRIRHGRKGASASGARLLVAGGLRRTRDLARLRSVRRRWIVAPHRATRPTDLGRGVPTWRPIDLRAGERRRRRRLHPGLRDDSRRRSNPHASHGRRPRDPKPESRHDRRGGGVRRPPATPDRGRNRPPGGRKGGGRVIWMADSRQSTRMTQLDRHPTTYASVGRAWRGFDPAHRDRRADRSADRPSADRLELIHRPRHRVEAVRSTVDRT